MMQRKKIVVGLTGNIASGKSSVGTILAEHGFSVIEADRIGWKLLNDPDVAEEILLAFGNVRKNGGIDRKKLGDIVFANSKNLKTLNSIMHPPLLKELKNQIEKSQADITVVNAALIFEWGIEQWFDTIVLVTCSRDKKLERLAAKGLTREQALQRLRSQIPEAKKAPRSDFTIENNGTLEELREKTLEVIVQIKKLAES
jgi:dephospho-CoA kinase